MLIICYNNYIVTKELNMWNLFYDGLQIAILNGWRNYDFVASVIVPVFTSF